MSNRRLNALITIGGAVSSSLGQAVTSTSQNVRRIGDAIRSTEQRQRALREEMQQYTAAGQDIGKLQREYDQLGRSLQRLEERHRSVNSLQELQRENASRTSEARGQLFDAVAMAAMFAAPITVAADFEQQMARVGAISRASAEDMALLSSTARELGASTEWSGSQAAQGMQFLAMAGFDVGETVQAMPGLLSLATAGQVDLAQATDISANILRGFGLEAAEMNRVGDVLVSTFTSSNTSLETLGETMKYVAPVASAVGMSIEEVAGAAGMLGNAGIKGSEAGTALRTVIARLSAPAEAGAQMLEELGIQTQDASGNMRPLADILVDIRGAMEGMGTAAQADVLRTIFGLEAMSAATILVEQAGSGALQRYTAELGEAGTAAEVAARQAATSRGAWLEFTGAVEELAITVGNALLPTLVGLLGHVTTSARWVGELAQRFPMVTTAVMVTAAALVGSLVTLRAATYAWYVFRGGLLAAQAAMVFAGTAFPVIVAGIRAIGAAMLTNPIGLIITAIAVGALLVWRYWEPIKAHFQQLWQDVTVYSRIAWDWIRGAWSGLGQFFAGVWDAVGGVFRASFAFIWTLVKWSPLGIFVNEWSPLYGFFVWLWDAIVGKAQRALDWIADKAGAVTGFFSAIVGGGNADLNGPRVDANGDPIVPGSPQAAAVGAAVAGVPAVGDATSIPDEFAMPAGGEQVDLSALLQGTASGAPAPVAATTNNVQITVNAAPGQDARSLAEEVYRLLRQRLEQETSGALYDGAAA